MGNALRRVGGTLVKRPWQRYNAEDRAHKALDKQEVQPERAPKFEADARLLETIRATRPEVAEAATKKDDVLHQRLRDVRR